MTTRISNNSFTDYIQPLFLNASIIDVLAKRYTLGLSLNDILTFSNSPILPENRRSDCSLIIGSFAQHHLNCAKTFADCDVISFVSPNLCLDELKGNILQFCDPTCHDATLWKNLLSLKLTPLQLALCFHLLHSIYPCHVFSEAALIQRLGSIAALFDKQPPKTIALRDFVTQTSLYGGEDEIHQMVLHLGPHRVELSCRSTLPYGFGLSSLQAHGIFYTPSKGLLSGLEPIIYPLYGAGDSYNKSEEFFISRGRYFYTPCLKHLQRALSPLAPNFLKQILKWLKNIHEGFMPYDTVSTLTLICWQFNRMPRENLTPKLPIPAPLDQTFVLSLIWLKIHRQEFEAQLRRYEDGSDNPQEAQRIATLTREMIDAPIPENFTSLIWLIDCQSATRLLPLDQFIQTATCDESFFKIALDTQAVSQLPRLVALAKSQPSLRPLINEAANQTALLLCFHLLQEKWEEDIIALLLAGDFPKHSRLYHAWAPKILAAHPKSLLASELPKWQELQQFFNKYIDEKPLSALFKIESRTRSGVEKRNHVSLTVNSSENMWNYWMEMLTTRDRGLRLMSLQSLADLPIGSHTPAISLCFCASDPVMRPLVAKVATRMLASNCRLTFTAQDLCRLAAHFGEKVIGQIITQNKLRKLTPTSLAKIFRAIEHWTNHPLQGILWKKALLEDFTQGNPYKLSTLPFFQNFIDTHYPQTPSPVSSNACPSQPRPVTMNETRMLQTIWQSRQKGSPLPKNASNLLQRWIKDTPPFQGEEEVQFHLLMAMDNAEAFCNLVKFYKNAHEPQIKTALHDRSMTLLHYWNASLPTIATEEQMRAFIQLLTLLCPEKHSIVKHKMLLWLVLFAIHQSSSYSPLSTSEANSLSHHYYLAPLEPKEVSRLLSRWCELPDVYGRHWGLIYRIIEESTKNHHAIVYFYLLKHATTLVTTHLTIASPQDAFNALNHCIKLLSTQSAIRHLIDNIDYFMSITSELQGITTVDTARNALFSQFVTSVKVAHVIRVLFKASIAALIITPCFYFLFSSPRPSS